jgi:hypothetical protein
MFKVSLSQFGNVHNLEEEKRKREGEQDDEVFLSVSPEGKARFEKGRKKPEKNRYYVPVVIFFEKPGRRFPAPVE